MMMLEAYNLLEVIENRLPKGTVVSLGIQHGSLKINMHYKDAISPREVCSMAKFFSKQEIMRMKDGVENVTLSNMVKQFSKAVDLRYNDMDQECDG